MSILKVIFSGDTKELDKALTKAQKGLDNFSNKAKDVGGKMSLFITAPIVAAGGAAIKFASDYQESLNKVDVAFKDTSSQVKSFAKTALNSFGIAEGTALDMAALFGDMSTSMGLTTGEAAKMSTALVGLAGDLSSFKNMNIEEVTTALNGVFTGETESLKRLGVVMTEANLQHFMLSQGIKGNIKDLNEAQKVMLRYEYVMAKTSNAHGDFARTGGGAANQMRIFNEGLKELGAQFGNVMLPLFTELITKVNGIVRQLRELDPETKKTILAFAAVAAAIGPLLLALAAMSTAINVTITSVRTLTVAFNLLAASPIAIVASAIVAAAGAMVYFGAKVGPHVSAIETLKNAYASLLDATHGGFVMRQSISEVNALGEEMRKAAAKQSGARIQGPAGATQLPLTGSNDAFMNLLGAVPDIPKETAKKIDMTPMVNALKLPSYGIKEVTQTWEKLPRSLGPTIKDTTAIVVDELKLAGNIMTQAQVDAASAALAMNEGIVQILQQGISSMASGLGQLLGSIASGASVGIEDVSRVLLGGIGEIAIQLGQLAISIGATMLAMKASLMNFNPFIAIAAGAALVALGSFVKGATAKIGAGAGGDRGRSGVPAFANGGIVSGPTIGLMGEYPGAKSNPEVIAPLDKLQSMLNNNGNNNVNVTGQFKVNGQDLVVALERSNKQRNNFI